VISRALPIPLYYQLKDLIEAQIRCGELRPGDRLPAEDELATYYRISKATVRQALADLAVAGLVRREQGRGTFVAAPKVDLGPRELTSFTHEMRKRDRHSVSRVLLHELIGAQSEVAVKLEVAEGARVCRLKRLRIAGAQPMGIQTAYIPLDVAPGVMEADFARLSLYEFLRERHGVIPARARETHNAVSLDPTAAALLQVPAGSPALASERITYLESSRPFELVHSVMRGDLYEIMLDLVNPSVR
jgi:GntR family transcriptional regulator